jgi:hypothetical protein
MLAWTVSTLRMLLRRLQPLPLVWHLPRDVAAHCLLRWQPRCGLHWDYPTRVRIVLPQACAP